MEVFQKISKISNDVKFILENIKIWSKIHSVNTEEFNGMKFDCNVRQDDLGQRKKSN